MFLIGAMVVANIYNRNTLVTNKRANSRRAFKRWRQNVSTYAQYFQKAILCLVFGKKQ
jgi:hypothetical protein